MKYVLDASVALKWVLPEPLADKARQVRDDYQSQIHELHAPNIFPVEVAHAIVRSERRNIIPVGYAARFLADIMSTAPLMHAYLPLLHTATKLASQARIGVYDCLYLALAQQEGCEFLTADDKLVKNHQQSFPFIKALSSI